MSEQVSNPTTQRCICNWSVGMGADVNCPEHGMGQKIINHYEARERTRRNKQTR